VHPLCPCLHPVRVLCVFCVCSCVCCAAIVVNVPWKWRTAYGIAKKFMVEETANKFVLLVRPNKQASKRASKRARLTALKPVYARARETLESTQHSHRTLRLQLHLQRNALLQDGDFLPKFRELGIPYDEIPPWMLELHTGAPLTW
jgi:hypothetical protein